MECVIMKRTIQIIHNKNSVGRKSVSATPMEIQHISIVKSKRRVETIAIHIGIKVVAAFGFEQLIVLIGKPDDTSTASILDSKGCNNLQYICDISICSILRSRPPFKESM